MYTMYACVWCDAIKQNESEVGNDMLLVSKVLFDVNICKCQW